MSNKNNKKYIYSNLLGVEARDNENESSHQKFEKIYRNLTPPP